MTRLTSFFDVVCLTVVSVWIVIVILPVSLYWIFLMNKYRKLPYIRKRYIIASLIGALCLLIWITCSMMTHIAFLFDANSPMDIALSVIYFTIYPITAQISIYCAFFRFWMIYFDFNYAISIDNQSWKSIINSIDNVSKTEGWVIKRRSTYGNPKYIQKYFIIACILTIFIVVPIRIAGQIMIISRQLSAIIDAAFYFIPLLCIFILWIKTPKFVDTIFVYKEFYYYIVIYIIGLAGNIGLTILGIIRSDLTETFFWEYIWIPVISFVTFGMIYIQTGYVLRKVLRNNKFVSTYKIIDTNSDKEMISMHSPKKKRLIDILQNKIYINVFMLHLNNELNLETLVCYIELTQLRVYMTGIISFMEHVTDMNDDNNMSSYNHVKLPNDKQVIPESEIIYHNNYNGTELFKIINIIIELYSKYISNNAPFCVNISYGLRGQISHYIDQLTTALLENDNYNKELHNIVYNLYEPVRQEMFKLLQDSLSRFVNTNEYKRISS